MNRLHYRLAVSFAFIILLLVAPVLFNITHVKAQPPQQYPILDKVADKVIQKYQQSSCEDLWKKKSEKAPPSVEEQKVMEFLKNDPQMRTIFINKVAGPIANKMFQCGMIP